MAGANVPTFKVIFLGTIDVGKTSLILRQAEGTFSEKNIDNFDKRDVVVNVGAKQVKLQITDTAGQERFRTLTSSYFRKAQAMIVVYDVSNEESFTDLEGFIKEGSRYSERSEKFIVGNKIDLAAEGKRKVSTAQGQALANKEGFPFYEVSAKTGNGVQELFQAVANKLVGNAEPATSALSSSGTVSLGGEESKPKKERKFCTLL